MSKASRVAVVASIDGIRYVLMALLVSAIICFFSLAFLDSFRSTSFRNMWVVSYLLDLASSTIDQLSSWLHAEWLLGLRRLSALVVAFLLWVLAIFVNAGLRAFSARITRALDLNRAEEISSTSSPSFH
jgi:hypothetical protein